ncbi:N,N-dimethylformamidase beta subunit family domain-containing protein [Thermoflavimicrobium dichotomicum]|uniref:N,N-dimethylformamidase beta subunit-like C-terminal domain-containing protein n=1 Tax=Thermoflavimicrobium dichotomicum TaxID=46223 RepID=A0A1I3TTB6_9BACL|nr:N,N-dimethylformamidase beta subunit family domain-containing protein [Thermoflavimicrobium dichotomicum]SFJ73860.1 hypothetical protein SAMN05421852_11965 [Thermoflavimicrobium dichotomicum]
MENEKKDWLSKAVENAGSKELTRRQLLKQIPKATGVLLGSALVTPHLLKSMGVSFNAPNQGKLLPAHPRTVKKLGHVDIRAENQKPGTTKWKITKPARPQQLQGYASDFSVQPEGTITFFVHSTKPYRMEIYRMGYYGGAGGRLMKVIDGIRPTKQNLTPDPHHFGAAWAPSQILRIPSDWPTGVYINKMTNVDGRESYIIFVVTETHPEADFAVQIATNSYHAYDNWGGKSLYSYNSKGGKQAYQVSFNRPFRNYYGSGLFFQYEYNLIRWLEKEGYSLTYITDWDIHYDILERVNIKALLIAGHAEYWTMKMRQSVEKLSATKFNLANFSANVCYWQVRYHEDSTGRPGRLMVSYKQFAQEMDPYRVTNKTLTTTRWRDQPVNMPEDSLFGVMYTGIPKATVPMVVSDAKHWLYEGTGLKNGDKIPGVIGGEVDSYVRNLPGVEVIAKSPVILYGKKKLANVVWYNKPTGKKAFSVGTFYWNWFLDPIHHTVQAKENKHIQQITKNALRELAK